MHIPSELRIEVNAKVLVDLYPINDLSGNGIVKVLVFKSEWVSREVSCGA